MNWKIIGSSLFALALLVSLGMLACLIGETRVAKVLNLTVLIFGAAAGWVVGIFIAPYTAEEQSKFTMLSKSVAVFGSGYLVGKIDKILERLFDPLLIFESVNSFRLLAGLSAFVIVAAITFVYRQYAVLRY
jgi:hypothetical protein